MGRGGLVVSSRLRGGTIPGSKPESTGIILIFEQAGKRELYYATSCHLFYFTKPSAENTLLWWENLLLNKLSRIKMAKLISFLTENENLIEQKPDATSSSDSNPNFSPSPRPPTDGPRP
ncbi:hypothetical protein AVEN_189498-1 [Araneus ventricosus]|uniref:Uncharacterized protein n=1 Tax=Araneus ventricosus TaxID=182803 RepID=A0A4Y2AAF2_ARAVE|nr:hypothetical protein AVEN_189498-1 [Araneus ventricosus]